MKFDDLDSKMRQFETAHDFCVFPDLFMVARLDGRGFTRLTKEVHQFEAPFDIRFRDHMTHTVEHLMNCGFRVAYGFTQSDEISLLFHRKESLFERQLQGSGLQTSVRPPNSPFGLCPSPRKCHSSGIP